MARNSMDVTAFVGKLLKEDDADILREGSERWRRGSWTRRSVPRSIPLSGMRHVAGYATIGAWAALGIFRRRGAR